VYALSQRGRARFGAFPAVTADDAFVRTHFGCDERATLGDCESIVFAPKTLRELVRIKSRSHYGCAELRRNFPHSWKNRGPGNAATLRALALCPNRWAKLVVYLYVKACARWGAWRQSIRGGPCGWQRDESSRAAGAVAPARAGSAAAAIRSA
jgi:hypothetical protein